MHYFDYLEIVFILLSPFVFLYLVVRAESGKLLSWQFIASVSKLGLFKFAPIAIAIYPLFASIFPSGSFPAYYVSGIMFILHKCIFLVFCPEPLQVAATYSEFRERGFTAKHAREWSERYGVEIVTELCDSNNNCRSVSESDLYWNVVRSLEYHHEKARIACGSFLLMSIYPIVISFIYNGWATFAKITFPMSG